MAGKLVTQMKLKSSGDLFHELFKYQSHDLSKISPQNVSKCELLDGEWGTQGSIVLFNYIDDGKEKVAKDILEVIDEEKKLITWKVIEGDLLEVYNSFSFTAQVETQGEDDVVTWTLDYEKPHEDVKDPHTLIDYLTGLTKDIEAHHLQQ